MTRGRRPARSWRNALPPPRVAPAGTPAGVAATAAAAPTSATGSAPTTAGDQRTSVVKLGSPSSIARLADAPSPKCHLVASVPPQQGRPAWRVPTDDCSDGGDGGAPTMMASPPDGCASSQQDSHLTQCSEGPPGTTAAVGSVNPPAAAGSGGMDSSAAYATAFDVSLGASTHHGRHLPHNEADTSSQSVELGAAGDESVMAFLAGCPQRDGPGHAPPRGAIMPCRSAPRKHLGRRWRCCCTDFCVQT